MPYKTKEQQKEYMLNHTEEKKAYDKQRYIDNKEVILDRVKAYSEPRKEIKQKYDKAWRATDNGKYIRGISHAKRKKLGFIQMNKYQEGYEAHHVDTEHVVYIPRKMHHSIAHNVFTWKNMDAINILALPYI